MAPIPPTGIDPTTAAGADAGAGAGGGIDMSVIADLYAIAGKKEDHGGAPKLDKHGDAPPELIRMQQARDAAKANRSGMDELVGDQTGLRRVMALTTGIPADTTPRIEREQSRVEKTAQLVKKLEKQSRASSGPSGGDSSPMAGVVGKAAGSTAAGSKVSGTVAEATDKVQMLATPDPKRLIGMGADVFIRDDNGDRHAGKKLGKMGLYALYSLLPPPWNFVAVVVVLALSAVVFFVVAILLAVTLATVNTSSPADAVAPKIAPPWEWFSNTSDKDQAEAAEAEEERAKAVEEMRKELDMEGVDVGKCLAPYGTTITTTPAKYIGAEAPEQPQPPVKPTRPDRDADDAEVREYNRLVREYNEAVRQYEKDAKEYRDTAPLYTTDTPVMEAGTEILTGDGELTDPANKVAEDLPTEASSLAAQAYLMTAWAGGTSGWDHFASVVRAEVPGGMSGITDSNLATVVAAFFEPGYKAEAYETPAAVALYALQTRGQFDGSGSLSGLEPFMECLDES